MGRRNLSGVLTGTTIGLALAGKANAGVPDKKSRKLNAISPDILFASQRGVYPILNVRRT